MKSTYHDSRSESCGHGCPCGAYEAAQKLLRATEAPVVRHHLGVRLVRRLKAAWGRR